MLDKLAETGSNMKGNQHRKLFNPDYFGWHYYCDGARRRQKQSDKQQAKVAARKERKASIKKEE